MSENGDYDRAFMFYEKAKKLNPKNPLLYLKWGITFLQLNKPSDAIECFNLSYQYDNENIVALFLLSATQAEIELFKSAYQNLKILLNIAPNHFDAINIISYCALKIKKYDEAIYFANMFLKVNKNVQSFIIIAESLCELNKINEALNVYETALKEFKEDLGSEFYVSYSKVLIKNKDYDKAYNYLNKVIDENNNYAPAYYYLACLYMEKGELNEAYLYFEKVHQINPNDINTTINMGLLSINMQQYDRAINLLNSILKLTDNIINVENHIASAYFLKHDFDNAIIYYNKSLDKMPNNIQSLKEITKIYIYKNEFEIALKYIRKAYKINKQDEEVCYLYGKIFENTNHPKFAIEKYEEVLEINKLYKEAILGKLRVLISLDKNDDANNFLEEVKSILGENDYEAQKKLIKI
ncbi:MAG: tetratricopeptide repeat protein [Candidatus Melainabacteria bacterium]|nr:MAG: tetratricopeptide repeat protein [Candidatus Melainabacteria bacterium]